MLITCSHNRILYGEFPKDKLENLDGVKIKVSIEKTDNKFADAITIDIDLLPDDNEINTAFQLGMLVNELLK